jgi:hypothetical protein
MNEIHLIRGSEYADFLRCRRRWNWAWNEQLKPKKLNDKLFIGTLIHKWLEVYYETNDLLEADKAMQKMYLEADTQYSDPVEMQELWELATAVTRNYVDTWYEEDQKYKVIATELQFMVKLDNDICFTGTIDLVLEDELGNVWFSDHKTTTSLEKYEKNSLMDRQISRYWWALQQIAAGVGRVKDKETDMWVRFEPLIDKEIYGFFYNIILKDLPKKPELLKKGGLSKNKAQKTTWRLYMDAIAEHELDPIDYEDILDHLRELPNRYFKRVEVIRSQQEIDSAIWEFFYTAEDMAGLRAGLDLERSLGTPSNNQTKPSDKLYRNITGDCAWDCQYKALCQAEIEGANTSLLLNMSYEKRDK